MKKERIFGGVLFILGAVALVMSNLGYLDDINVFSILLTIGLVGIVIKSLFTRSFSGVLFPIAFICIIYTEQLGIGDVSSGVLLLAALLGSVGLSMIFSKGSNRSYNKSKWKSYEHDTIDLEDESHIRLDTLFAGSIKYINTEKFEQANLKCSFGSMKVYFDNAILYKGNGIVRLDASFSGVELYIPKAWTINDKTSIFFGTLDEKNKNEPIVNNTLTLVGNISFSGVEIIYI